MGPRRLRARLDGLEANAHQTMNDAQQVLHVAQAFLEELLDGIDFVVTVKNRQTGELEELPIGIRIKPKGEDGVEQQPITTQ